MSIRVEITWDRTIKGEVVRNMKIAAMPTQNDFICVGDQSFEIRSITIVANPKRGEPEAYIRLRGSI